MANEKSDINDIVKKCKILLLDIEGTTTSISFVKVGLTIDRPVFCLNMCFMCSRYLFSIVLCSFIHSSTKYSNSTCKMVANTDLQHGGQNQNGTPFHSPLIV